MILSLAGEALGTSDGKTVRLTTSSRIHPGETVAVSAGGRLDLLLLPGVLVELTGNTEIEIKQLRLARDGDETIGPMTAREAKVRLVRGTLIGSVGQAQMRSKILVETSAGALTAFDLRTFRVEVDGSQIKVMSVRGQVTFVPASGGAPTKIGAGYFAEWPSQVAGPQAAAESGREAQTAVTSILTVEKRLLRLEKAARFEFVPWRK